MDTSPRDTLDDPTHPTKENVTLKAPDSDNIYSDISAMMWIVIPPLLLVFGTFGNVMTVVVMRGMRASESTACLSVYFTGLAVSDQLQLTTNVLYLWGKRVFHWPPSFYFFNLLCNIPKFIWNIGGVMSAWFLVALTYQRVTSVVAPHRVGVLCTVRRGYYVVTVIVIGSLTLHSQFLFNWVFRPKYEECQYAASVSSIVMEVFEWLDLFFFSIIPFLLLASGNSLLVWHVLQSTKLSMKMRGGDHQKTKSGTDQVQSITITLIVTSSAFLILTMPVCIYGLVQMFSFYDNANPALQVVNSVCDMLYMSSCAYNFYLYLLSGRRFRDETKRYLSCHGAS